MYKIIADENIVFAKEAFSQFGEVELYSGRKLNSKLLKDVDILIIRSITKVNEALLEGTRIKFVGTATTGNDHVDQGYLKRKKIFFADAKGCNADSVAEYVFTALMKIASENKIELNNKTFGVIGFGNIGSRVSKIAESFGMKVLKNDPPLERNGTKNYFVKLEEVLQADIVSLHVPLTTEGLDKTFHLLNEKNLKLIKENSILINTSRGEVIDNKALLETVRSKKIKLILDVWENEPEINRELLKLTDIGTAHIAGYSYEGKVNGTRMIFDALNKFTGGNKKRIPILPEIDNSVRKLSEEGSKEKTSYNLLSSIYNIQNDDELLRNVLEKGVAETGQHFDKLRKEYPVRREFNNFKVLLNRNQSDLKNFLLSLRFQAELV